MKQLNAPKMSKIDFSQDEILSKKELQSLKGGETYLCTCTNNDGTKTMVGEASSATGCASLCQKYWDTKTTVSKDLQLKVSLCNFKNCRGTFVIIKQLLCRLLEISTSKHNQNEHLNFRLT